MPEHPFNDCGWRLDERATLYVPYTRLSEATEVFVTSPLSNPCPTVLVDVSAHDWAYNHLLEHLWIGRKDFIILEHDIVPWPGAIHELMKCPRPWCFFGYQDQVSDLAECSAAMFGLVRFRSVIMDQLHGCWVLRRKQAAETPPPSAPGLTGPPWRGLDIWFFHYAIEHGWMPHQHHPGVLNANPKLLYTLHRETVPQPWRVHITEEGEVVSDLSADDGARR